MKFLCDRCKTRYSIGDDRVRGKILKIRCKNCANVITVREGMSDGEAELGTRKRSTTTAAPSVIAPPMAAPAAGNGARPVGGPGKPPAALEEEWYVSIDGEQEGPYSLVDAQRWVGAKGFDDDLHCWSEGFDDWLPVDKVSHFRGLRKKAAPPSAPPPIPRGGPQMRVGATAVEDEPQPLFAATMASIESSAPPAGMSLPSMGSSAPRPSATPPLGERSLPVSAKTNGAATKVPTIPAAFPVKAPGTQPGVQPMKRAESPRPATKNGFDTSNDQATQIEARPFDEVVKAPEAPATPAIAQPSNVSSVTDNDDDDEDGLSIGEVSRVVKLADLMASAKPRGASAAPQRRSSPALAPNAAALNRTGGVARISATGLVERVDDPALSAEMAIAGSAAAAGLTDAPIEPAPAPVQQSHRRGLAVLIGVAGVLLAGVIVAVVILVGNNNSSITGLGKGNQIDTSRPDDPLRRSGEQVAGSATAPNPYVPPVTKLPVRPKNPIIPTETPLNPTSGDRIGGDEVEAMARTQSSTTQRCYLRSQRGVDAITIGDVKKINVTLEIGGDGAIKTVSLDSNSTNTLGKCLTSAIKGWKFRPSPGGTYRFALVFSSS